MRQAGRGTVPHERSRQPSNHYGDQRPPPQPRPHQDSFSERMMANPRAYTPTDSEDVVRIILVIDHHAPLMFILLFADSFRI